MMTREEVSVLLKMMFAFWANTHERTNVEMEMALNLALTALRGPTKEIVERMRGEWVRTHSTDNFWTEVWKCPHCGFEDDNGDCFDFCPVCGAPMTDEAVDIELRRWKEAVGNG